MIYINKAKYVELAKHVRTLPQEITVSTHEWEEVVHKMCTSEDADFRDLGFKELNDLKRRR